MYKIFRKFAKCRLTADRCLCTIKEDTSKSSAIKFETVFTFPTIKYVSILNRLKVYQILGASVAIPGSGILEALNAVPSGTLLTASYIGLTGAAVLSVATLPFRNTIGFIYISEDNTQVKISSMDFWGKRIDRIVPADDWIPLLDMSPKLLDALYLTPQLADGTKYKLFIKFGNVLNAKKIGQVLE
ncbi:transmembrane protein 186 [Anticarsia gemmatalis]|uniref:transmembrane protein 186 n=1 Tax=Anticarsia gemmatalis TaxID=129554 RepID=UPI003F770ED9